MGPFAYDSKRSFSVGSILLFTTAASLGFLILTKQYLANYQIGDQLLIIALTALAMNGILTSPIRIISKYVEFPQRRKPNKTDQNEFDFD